MTGVISDIFLRLLNMSISAAFIIFVILGLRILLSKFSRRAAPVIWTAVAIKLVYPWNFQSSSNVALQNMDVSTYRSSSQSMIINHRDVLLGHVVLSEKCLILAGCIWLVGMAALVLYVVVKNWRLNRRLKTAVLYDENIWICDYIDEAFVKGVFSPRIYLPSYIEHEDLPYILRHEKLHIKRRDNWLKMIGFLFLMVYWFQPMCWVAYLMFAKDLEFACDEAVVHGMKILERKRYAKILLKFSTCQKRDVFYPLTFGYRGLKRRVEAVLIKRKMSHYVIGIIGALSITVIITVIAKPNTLFASTDTEEAWNILCEKVRDADLTEDEIGELYDDLLEQGYEAEDIALLDSLGKNENGQLYGPEDLNPDLIEVTSDQGIDGYCYYEDLYEYDNVNSPEDAVNYMAEMDNENDISIPVYDTDGTTKIGTFTLN